MHISGQEKWFPFTYDTIKANPDRLKMKSAGSSGL